MAGAVKVFLLLLAFSFSAHSWIAPKSRKAKTNVSTAARWVQGATGETGLTNTTVATSAFASAITAGNLVICGTNASSNTIGISGMTDSLGNTYVKARAFYGGTSSWSPEIWYKENHTGGAAGNVVTATWASAVGSYKSISCHEYYGMLTSGAFDTSVVATSTDNDMTLPALVTSYDDELLFFASDSSSYGIIGNGYTRSLLSGNLVADTPAPKAGPQYIFHKMQLDWMSVSASFRGNGTTPAVINTAETFTATAGSTLQTPAFGTQPVAGRTIICLVAGWIGSAISGVADTAGNTYSRATAITGRSGTYGRAEIWYRSNIATTATFQVTATYASSGNEKFISCHQVSNLNTSGALDATAATTGPSGNPKSGAITTTSTNQFIFNGTVQYPGQETAAFTRHSSLENNVIQSRYVTTAGTYYADTTHNGTFSAVAASFRARKINPISAVHTVEGRNFDAGSNSQKMPPFAHPSNNTEGNTIVCAFTFNLTSGTVSSVVDTAGNSYYPVGTPVRGTGGNSAWSTEMYYAPNIKTADSNQITWTTSANASKTALCTEFAGISPNSPLDQTAQATPTSTRQPSAGSVTTTSAQQLMVAHHQCTNGSQNPIGIDKLGTVEGDSTIFKIVNSAGANTLAGTTGVSSDCNSKVATFKASTANVEAPKISYIQTTPKYQSGSSTGGNVTFPATPRAGSLVLVRIGLWGGSSNMTSVTDNNGTTYNVACTIKSASGGRASIYYGTVGVSPSSPFTVTASGTSNEWSFAAQEYTGVTTLDQTATKAGTPAYDRHYSGKTAMTTAPNELIASIINWSAAGTGTISTNGFTTRYSQLNNAYPLGQGDDRIVSEQGQFEVLWYSYGNQVYDACIATFK